MPRLADPKKLAGWRQRLERFSKSGLPVGRFCAREGVSTASFYHWRKKLDVENGRRRGTHRQAQRRPDRANGRGGFQPVAVVPVGPGSVPAIPVIVIQLPCGTRIEVGGGDLDVLWTVVAEVARAGRGDEGRTASC